MVKKQSSKNAAGPVGPNYKVKATSAKKASITNVKVRRAARKKYGAAN